MTSTAATQREMRQHEITHGKRAVAEAQQQQCKRRQVHQGVQAAAQRTTLVPPTPHPTPRDLRFWRTWAHCEGGARVAGSREQATLPDAKLDIPPWDVAARRAVCFQQAPRAPTRFSASSCGLIFFVGNMNAL